MHFNGVFKPQKAFASGAAPRRLASGHYTQEVHLCSRLSASIFGPWGLVRLLRLQFLATPT